MKWPRRSTRNEFPHGWRDLLGRRLSWWPLTDPVEQARIERLIMEFLDTKQFEGSRGFDPSEDIRVTIAAQACLLIVGLDIGLYRDVSAIIVHPSIAVRSGRRRLDGGIESVGDTRLAGEAMLHGPVMIAWDQALGAARNPERGHNVVFHEFAHKLDMANGAADGIPPLPDGETLTRWEAMFEEALDDLRMGRPRFIDGYGATGPSELFAVLTEAFFDVPRTLKEEEPELYSLLSDFYRQDPIARG